MLSFLFGMDVASASVRNPPSPQNVYRHIGSKDAVLVHTPDGQVLLTRNAHKNLTPASTLKILTSLVVLDTLGPNYQYKTDFFMDKSGNLTIRGYGDPLLISEMILLIVAELHKRLRIDEGGVPNVRNIVLDNTFFGKEIVIPGVTSSYQPYDAPNGALCVNFNTVTFKKNKAGRYVSGEVQTPLIPQVMDRVRNSGLRKGRIILSQEKNEHLLYTGHLFRYFLNLKGIPVNGDVVTGQVKETDTRIYTFVSPFRLTEIISKILEFSNNFITNQLLITAGAVTQGEPGTLEKGVRTAFAYIDNTPLAKSSISLVEGSGISRNNKISSHNMMRVLERFRPYHHLMKMKSNSQPEYFKTGTLKGVRTRAGYIQGKKGLYPFVVFMNTPGKTTDRVMDGIHAMIARMEKGGGSGK